ncbi:MAG TPA: type II secretion system F family protein, partial [Sedimentibacter sp.]|nr:type II secretion system F family protein [Sedimentibacter sp.]
MISYKCNVIDISGNKQRITCAGNSRKDVIDFLKLQEYTVVKINDKKTINLGNISKNVKSKDLAVFCKQTHAMLKAGVTIVNILKILKQQTENRKLRGYIGLMHEEL